MNDDKWLGDFKVNTCGVSRNFGGFFEGFRGFGCILCVSGRSRFFQRGFRLFRSLTAELQASFQAFQVISGFRLSGKLQGVFWTFYKVSEVFPGVLGGFKEALKAFEGVTGRLKGAPVGFTGVTGFQKV